MDIVHAMHIFVRVAEFSSFTAAAESLGYSTPHVSRSISDLEVHLRAKLINRTTRKVALTEAGYRYLERCKVLLEDLKLAELEAAGAHLEAFGKLRMHSPNGIGHYHIIPLIAKYSQLQPNVDFELNLSQASPDLLAEGYDLVISADSRVSDSSFIARELGETYSVFCAGPAYIQEHGLPEEIDQLKDHTCLRLHDPSFPKGWEIDGYDMDEVISPRQTFTVNVAGSIAQAAKENMGVCLIPSYVAASSIARGDLIRVLPTVKANQRSISVIYPSRHFLDAKVRTWVEFLKGQLPTRLQGDEAALQAGASGRLAPGH